MTDPHAVRRGVPSPLTRIGRYEIGAVIGAGGMGVVHRASDPELKRPLAIKLVRDPGGAIGQERVLREAQAMARLRHPNVVPVFDVGTVHGLVYLVMPLLDGGTLGAWMREEPRPWPVVLERFLGAARGLATAHAAGLVHRDFKPDNVLLGAVGEVQVADFGLARVDSDHVAPAAGVGGGGPAITEVGAIMGTPAYMAPEQLDGGLVDAAADQFGFCVALHEGVYGQRPFDVSSHEASDLTSLRAAIRSARLRRPPPDRMVPRWLRAAILRGLRDDPGERWPSMAALIAELERRRQRPRRVLLGVGLVAVAALVVGLRMSARAPQAVVVPTPMAASEPTRWIEEPLTFRGDVIHASLSPDGRSVAATAGRDLVSVTIEGGAVRTLVRYPAVLDDTDLAWSTDGSQLAVNSLSIAELVDVATGTTTPITPSRGFPRFIGPRTMVSAFPAAKKLAFEGINASHEAWECPVPGEYQWITKVDVAGTSVFATVVHQDGRTGLVVTNRDCFVPHVHVAANDASAYAPLPDGRVFALRSAAQQPEVVEYDASGVAVGAPRRLRFGEVDLVGARPDGSLVLRRAAASWRLFSVGNGEPADVARGAASPLIAMSPDGRRLALVERVPGKDSALYVVPVDDPEERGSSVISAAVAVAWSPGGQRLAAAVVRESGVQVVEIDVVTGVIQDLGVSDASFVGQVAWLDDRRLAYLRADHRTYRWIDRVDRTSGDLVDDRAGYTFYLAASSDGTLALFWNRDQRGLWMVPSTGKARLLRKFDLGAAGAWAWSADGRTLWLADGNRIERFDPRSGKFALVRTLDLEPTASVAALFPVGSDRVVVHTVNTVSDLALLVPEAPAPR